MKTKIFLLPALVFAAAFFTACSDDEEYDFPGNPQVLVYTADFSGAYKILQTPAGAFASMSVPVTAKVNGRSGSDIKVTVAVDNSLIDAYNEENGTAYLPIPPEAILFDKNELTIPAGEMRSADTVTVSLTENAEILKNLNDDNGYIVPVRLQSVSGGGAGLANSVKSISYLTISVTNDAVNHSGTLKDSKGTPVTDWSGWSVTETDGNMSGWEKMFDGNPESYWSAGYNTTMVTVDMGKIYKFDAIQAYYGLSWGSYTNTFGSMYGGTKISISIDGTNWSNMGEIERSSLSAYDNVVFYGSIEARYIKLHRPTSFSFTCGYFTVYAL